jgi:outer membrane protein TolC
MAGAPERAADQLKRFDRPPSESVDDGTDLRRVTIDEQGVVTGVNSTRGAFRLAAILFFVLLLAGRALAQSAPPAADRPWLSRSEQRIVADARRLPKTSFSIDPNKIYSLAELVDLAEQHNPVTRYAWERAKAQAAALGIARSELYPIITSVALAEGEREEVLFGPSFFRQTFAAFEAGLTLNYTILDFGARAGRIEATGAELFAADFAFNDTHRRIIYDVAQTYYRLLNAVGQEDAAQASLLNAQNAQQAAEDRLKNGLATLPDVLEARSATAQAQFDLQTAVGAEEIARGDLANALGTFPTVTIRVQPIGEISTPEAISDSVDRAIDRALEQRPDLMEQIAEIRAADARVKQARAAYYPTLSVRGNASGQNVHGIQQQLPAAQVTSLVWDVRVNLNWTVFDGGARRNNLAQAESNLRAAQAQVSATRDQVADEVWRAYSNLKTAFRQRQAAIALLEAASQSYAATLEAYGFGVRNFLDVTAAQRVLAQARSADVTSRAQVLTELSDLAFRTADLIRSGVPRPRP